MTASHRRVRRGSGAAPAVSGRRFDFAIVFAVMMAVAAGNSGLQSVLPAIGREIHIPDPLVAGIFSLSALLWTLSAPVWARASDRRGRKPMIAVGLLGFVVSMTGCAAVVLAGLHHLIGPMAVFLGFASLRAVFGLIGSASNPAGQAYVADRTSEKERTDALATLAGAFGVGTVLGPAIAPYFVLPFVTFAGPMFFFAMTALVCLVVVLRFLPGDGPEARAARYSEAAPDEKAEDEGGTPDIRIWFDARVAPFLVYGFLVGSAQAVNGYTLGFLVIDKVHLTPVQAQGFIQVAMMGGAVAGLMAQWGLIRMFRMKPNDLLLWGAGLAAIGNLATVFAPSYGAAVTAYALTSIGYGFARPGFSAGASLGATSREQGAVAGAVTAVNGSCVIITPILGVWLYDHVHFAPFALNTLVLAVMTGFVILNPRLRNAGSVSVDAEALEELEIAEGPAGLGQVGMGETPVMHENGRNGGPVNQLKRRLRAIRLLEARRRRARLRSGADQSGRE
jgi:MFS family permease